MTTESEKIAQLEAEISCLKKTVEELSCLKENLEGKAFQKEEGAPLSLKERFKGRAKNHFERLPKGLQILSRYGVLKPLVLVLKLLWLPVEIAWSIFGRVVTWFLGLILLAGGAWGAFYIFGLLCWAWMNLVSPAVVAVAGDSLDPKTKQTFFTFKVKNQYMPLPWDLFSDKARQEWRAQKRKTDPEFRKQDDLEITAQNKEIRDILEGKKSKK